jgi:two-component SAPR family response regulator
VLSVIDEKDGVTTNNLTDTFWPGVSKLKAKENRNGNIRKLRKVLSQMEGLQVVFENKKWYAVTSHNFEIDIYKYKELKERIALKLNQGRVFVEELEVFLELLKKGNVLQNTQVEWVDFYKNKISNEVENLLSKVYKSQQEKFSIELNIKIAKTILLFDNLNEDALKILISEFVASGKHGLAKNAYSTFSKNYEALYAEPFNSNYQSFVKKH